MRGDYEEPRADSSTPLKVLREQLELARARGERFGPAWPGAVKAALEAAKPTSRREWRWALENTRSTWERCYDRLPPTRAEGALVDARMLLDREPIPDVWCVGCEQPLGTSPIGAYCSRRCTREASAVLFVPELGTRRGEMRQPELPLAA